MLVLKISLENNDRTANEQECVVATQESTSRHRAALLDLAEGLPKGNPPSGSADSMEKRIGIGHLGICNPSGLSGVSMSRVQENTEQPPTHCSLHFHAFFL